MNPTNKYRCESSNCLTGITIPQCYIEYIPPYVFNDSINKICICGFDELNKQNQLSNQSNLGYFTNKWLLISPDDIPNLVKLINRKPVVNNTDIDDYYVKGLVRDDRILMLLNNGMDITTIPPEELTEEMCEIAINSSNGKAFEFVPDKFKTKKMCERVAYLFPHMSEFIPKVSNDTL